MKQTSTDIKRVKYNKKEVEDADHKLFIKQQQYDKYIEGRKKQVTQLKSDPNIHISHEKNKNDSLNKVTLEYKGDYVTSKKIVRDVDNEVIKELKLGS